MFCICVCGCFLLSGIIDSPRQSLFSYLNGKTWATYYDPLFQPAFEPEFQDTDLEMEANRLCGDDIFCLFDIAATGNTELGLSTLHTSQEIERLEKLSLPSEYIIIHTPQIYGLTFVPI